MSTLAASVASSGLPKYVEDHANIVIYRSVRILLIVILALVIRFILHRMINGLVRPIENGSMPKVLRPLKERAENTALLSSTVLSERRTQRAATIGTVLKSTVSATIFAIAVMMILDQLGLNLAPLIAGTSIVGVAFGFGAQNVVKDFLGGMFMILEDQYGVGDVIDFEKASGTVESVGLRTTRLRDVNGTVWYVRNGEVVRVGNKSQGFAQVVLDVPIDVAADVEAASAAMLDVARAMRADENWSAIFISDPELEGIEELTREGAVVRLVVKVRPLEQWRTARELRLRIWERLTALHISSQPAQTETTGAPEDLGTGS